MAYEINAIQPFSHPDHGTVIRVWRGPSPEACMALPGRSKSQVASRSRTATVPVATVTYINYPSRKRAIVSTRDRMRAPVLPSPRAGRGFSERPYAYPLNERCMMLTEFTMVIPCPHELVG